MDVIFMAVFLSLSHTHTLTHDIQQVLNYHLRRLEKENHSVLI